MIPCFACIVFLLLVAPPARADEVDDEFRFASALIERGFPDFARKVLANVLREHPDREQGASLVRAQLLMANRQFAEAEEVIRSIDGSSSAGRRIRLILARYYYKGGDIEKAKSLYEDFFAQFQAIPKDPGLLMVYLDAAFKFAQMLALAGDYEGAIGYLDRALKGGPEQEKQRLIEELQARYHLRAAENSEGSGRSRHLAAVEEIAGDIEFGGPFWVARGALLRADVARVAGRPDEALEMLENQRKIFSQYERSLEEEGAPVSDSPKAGYYFSRARANEDKGDALLPGAVRNPDHGETAKRTFALALNDYARVLKKYPNCSYASDAVIRFGEVSEKIIELGGKIVPKKSITDSQSIQPDRLFAQADQKFKAERHEEAARAYLEVLNKHPDTSASPRVLSNLGKSYLQLDDLLMARVVYDYLSERYAGDPAAAQASLILASYFRKHDKLPLAYQSYKLFAARFPAHPKAAQVLYTVAVQAGRDGEAGEAARLYGALTRMYPGSEYFLKALRALGWDAYKLGQYERALEKFVLYAEEAPEGYHKANAALVAADCQLRLEDNAGAFRRFGALAEVLDPALPENPYYVDDETREKVSLLYEQAMFQKALALSRIIDPPEKVPAYLAKSIEMYDEFVRDWPTSQFAPKALASKGVVLLQLDRLDEATGTFEQLAGKYPDTAEGKNSLYQLVEAAVKIDNLDVARDAVERIAADPAAYGIDTFARIGELMLSNSLYEQAISAYEKLLNAAGESGLKERAYFGLGKSLLEKGDCGRAAENLQALLALNRRTGFFFDANLYLARALKQCGSHDEALDALREIFTLDSDRVRLRKANVELAGIQAAQGRAADAYATYLRMVLTTEDPARPPELVDINRSAALAAIELGMKMADYETVIFLADRFQGHWGKDEAIASVREVKNQALLERSKLLAGKEEESLVELME